MPELKECPFCGGEFYISQEPSDNGSVANKWYVYHAYGELGSAARKCPLEIPRYFDTLEEAVSAINTRTPNKSDEVDLSGVRTALEYAGTLIKFCVKPEKCVTRGDIEAGTDVMKSALQIYKEIQEALDILPSHLATGKGGDGITGETSDGYHTFNELYEHRHILFLSVLTANVDRAWRSKLHDDGTMFDGWFVAGLKTVLGHATYHLPIRMWSLFDAIPELEKAPPFDGHTAEDTLKRLRDDAYFGRKTEQQKTAEPCGELATMDLETAIDVISDHNYYNGARDGWNKALNNDFKDEEFSQKYFHARPSIHDYKLAKETVRTLRVQPPSIDGLEEAIKETEYKYFGYYEFSERQWAAVNKIVDASRRYLALTKPSEAARAHLSKLSGVVK